MRKNSQDQAGGDSSTNLQAGRDLHFHGASLSDVREIALDVYKANVLELGGIAHKIALQRAEEITDDFLNSLKEENASKIQSLASPDMQFVMFEAQKEYARAGEEDLKSALVHLLTQRACQEKRDLRTIALNEAVFSVSKLTEDQRKAIAWVFYLRYTRNISSRNIDDFYKVFGRVVDTLGTNVPERHADYQHIEYVGAGTVSFTPVPLGSAIRSGSEGLFTNGFSETEIKPPLLAELKQANLIKPCARNNDNLQIDYLAQEDLPDTLRKLGLENSQKEIDPLLKLGILSDSEVTDEAANRIPKLRELEVVWNSETIGLQNLTLTSVGLALGHAYWTRLTGNTAPLSIWL